MKPKASTAVVKLLVAKTRRNSGQITAGAIQKKLREIKKDNDKKQIPETISILFRHHA
jgi:hypothetical protein